MRRCYFTDYEARGHHPMRAIDVLQDWLGEALQGIHLLRSRVLMRAVGATIAVGCLTLIDLARAWPDAQLVRAPLRALGRVLGNRHLPAARERIHGAIVCWLVRSDDRGLVGFER